MTHLRTCFAMVPLYRDQRRQQPILETWSCWTVDYSKLPKLTLCGWQEVCDELNQNSSANYYRNSAYGGTDCILELQGNCSSDLALLNGEPSRWVLMPYVIPRFK